MSTDYNGWKNYPTWNVNLWLSNDEPLYREALERTEAAMNAAEADQIEHPYWSEEECLRYGVADMLKTWVRDELAPDLGATFAADLLGYALDDVDWHEIADVWIEQVVDQATNTASGTVAARLEYLRGEIRAERISYGEIAELQALVEHIDPSDVELLEWAGVSEHETWMIEGRPERYVSEQHANAAPFEGTVRRVTEDEVAG